MPQIIVDAAEAPIISESPVVEIRDQNGRLVGLVTKDLLEDIEIARERMKRPSQGMTTQEMLDWLQQNGDDR
jgi:hypothetical protein